MPKVMSSNEVKQQWGSMISYVTSQGDEVIVESHGKPKAVVISVSAYEEFQSLRERQRRADALDLLRDLHERLAIRNQGNSEAEEIEFADRLAHELIDDMAARGDITFERDLH